MTTTRECKSKVGRLAAVVLLAGLAMGPIGDDARAGQRLISVNGAWLSPQEILTADDCVGFILPDGDYWLDHESGYWGVVGGPAVGRLPAGCTGGQGGAGRGYTYSGPGGHTGSDGSCGYYFDPETGTSVMTGNC
jgi:hypothetical protein